MNGDTLEEKTKMLQDKYTELLTQAAQEGRIADVESLSTQMQHEIESLINAATQSALAGNDEGQEEEVEEVEETEEEDWEVEEIEEEDWEVEEEEEG